MKNIYQLVIISLLILVFSNVSIFGQTTPTQTPKPTPTNTVSNYSLVIENEDGKQTKLTLADIAKLKRQTVKGNDHGTEATFEGYPLIEVLKLAGIEFGETLRGKRLAAFLLVEAADKYQAVFALPELDPAFTDKTIILADRRDASPLSEKEGVLRIVVPDEKKQGRWVRQVTSLKIIRVNSSGK
jgi:DMSO/TMAO reductase YedYZ molybdopterin-dependent catalytic subunit